MLRLLLVLAAVLAAGAPAAAHEVRPAYLELREVEPERYEATWKVPVRSGMKLRLSPRLPEPFEVQVVRAELVEGALRERWTVTGPGSLVGGEIAVDGLAATLTDVLVRIERLDGTVVTERLTPSRPSFIVPAEPGALEVSLTYLELGVEHILGGVDHLLFVLALLLIVRGRGRLVATVTAFTLAHSITLGLATLGVVSVPSAPVEAVIALSILFLAAEIANERRGRHGWTARAPWVIAFTFGLLHGFGFAGALTEVGLPQRAVPLALLFFNLGVEVGQLLFIAGVLALAAIARRMRLPDRACQAAWRVATLAIGVIAAFWSIERVAGFWV